MHLADYAKPVDAPVQIRAVALEVMQYSGVAQLSHEHLTFKNRDRAAIIADILSSLVRSPRGERKTNIRQSANLSSDLLKKYLDLLLINGFVKVEEEGIYKPTTRGLELLQNLAWISNTLR